MKLCTTIVLPLLGALAAQAAVLGSVPDEFSSVTSDNRITNGTMVAQGDAPFLVRLIFVSGNRHGLCGGTIIDSTTIVTAGHCVQLKSGGEIRSPKDTYIFYGSVSSKSTKYIQPTKVTLHPEYNPNDFRNDIAILKVPEIKFEKGIVEAVPVYDKSIAPKQAMNIFGWGTTRSHGTASDNPPSLLTQTVHISEPKACQVIEPRYNSANDSQICTDAHYDVGVDACQGDSGTGSTIKKNGKHYLAGLVSYGTNRKGEATCGEDGSFGMYTRISYFLPWIKLNDGGYTVGPPADEATPSAIMSQTSPTPAKPMPTSTCYFFIFCF
ncbi:serine-type endopeptidase activity protein [Coemansia sp. RSA 678]|nr:serine-type endopeptidase activity protein [Coemansia sp. RSA 678]